MSTGTEKKPSIEDQAPQTYLQVEAGIYRYKDKEGTITYHERPFINGKRSSWAGSKGRRRARH